MKSEEIWVTDIECQYAVYTRQLLEVRGRHNTNLSALVVKCIIEQIVLQCINIGAKGRQFNFHKVQSIYI